MSVAYQVDMPDGSTAAIPPSKVVADLEAVGVPATLTANGQNIQYTLDNQLMTMPVRDLIGQTVGQVTGIAFDPNTTDFSGVDNKLRLGIENLPNDRLKQKFLELQLEAQGMDAPQVFGQGSDWAVFNPQTGQYKALTNKPGMDWSDLGQVGAEAARFAGNLLGGVGGAALGAGAGPLGILAGGSAGAGAGGQLGRGLVDVALAASTPGYRETLASLAEEGLGDFLGQRGTEALIDTAGGLLGTGLGMVPGLKQGLVTRAGSLASGGLEKTGQIAASAGGAAARSDIAKAIGPELAMNLGGPQLAAWIAQGPAYVARKLPNIGQWTARKLGRPELAEEMANLGMTAARNRSKMDSIMDAYKATVGGKAFTRPTQVTPTAGDVLEDIGGGLTQKIRDWSTKRRTMRDIAAQNARASGGGLAEEAGAAAARAAPFETNFAARKAKDAADYIQGGFRNVGDIAEGVAMGGRAVERGIMGAAGLGYRGIQGLGLGAQGLGKAGKLGFGALQPLEYRLYGTGLGRMAEENY